MANMKNTHVGFVVFTYLLLPVLSQQLTQCYYNVYTGGIVGAPNFKTCFYGCCSQVSIEPCCASPVHDKSLGPGAIGGIVIGVIVALIIFGGVIFFSCYRKSKKGGDKYMTPAKPHLSYITKSAAMSAKTETTDLSRLPPDDELDNRETSSYHSNKSESYSQQSDPQSDSKQNLSRTHSRPTDSTSSIDSHDYPPPKYEDSQQERKKYDKAPSLSSSTARDRPPARSDSSDYPPPKYEESPQERRKYDKPPPVSSTSSRDRRPARNEDTRQHRRQYDNTPSVSSSASRDPQRHEETRQHRRQYDNTSSVSSSASRDHPPREPRPRQQSRGYPHSTSSLDSKETFNRSASESVV